MHHGRHDEGEAVLAAGEGVALGDDVVVERIGQLKELTEHGLDLCVANDGEVGVSERQLLDRCGVIRLHVRDHKVVKSSAAERVRNVLEKAAAHRLVDGVEQDGLFVQKQV